MEIVLLYVSHNSFTFQLVNRTIPVAVRPKAQACSSSIAEIAVSNPADGMAVSLLCLLCIV